MCIVLPVKKTIVAWAGGRWIGADTGWIFADRRGHEGKFIFTPVECA